MSKKRGLIVAALTALAFGLYPPSAKMAYRAGANPTFLIITTTFFRGIALGLYCLIAKKPVLPVGREWFSYTLVGFIQSVSIFGIIGSLLYLPGPVTITLIFTHTLMLLLFLAYRGEAVLNKISVVATVCALFGVSLVVDVWHNLNNLSLVGISLALLGAVATASRLYVFGKQLRDSDPETVGARTFLIAFLFTLTLLFFNTPIGPESSQGQIWVGLCCLSLILGTFAMFHGIALLGSFQFSLMVKLEPAFTAIFSILIVNEVLSAYQYVGMVLVIASLVIYQCYDKKALAVGIPPAMGE